MPDSILLYRYLDAAAALKTIESRLLRISRLRDLNDPFEMRMGVTGTIPEGETTVNAWLDSIREQQNNNHCRPIAIDSAGYLSGLS